MAISVRAEVSSSFLAQWYDSGLSVRPDDTPAAMGRVEVERLAKLLAIAIQVQTIPRRLGGEAGPEELALDKRRAKRIAHVAGQLLTAWGGKPNTAVGDISREAAQVNWTRWMEEHRVWLLNRQKYLATWCLKLQRDEKWTKSALVKLSNELQWLTYALRD